MGRKKVLEKRLLKLKNRLQALRAKALASDSADEVRAINDQMAEINEDIADIQDEIAAIDAESRDEEPEVEESRQNPPAGAQQVNGGIVGSFGQRTAQRADESMLESMEYRQAFRRLICQGTPIPAELRAGDAITTTDTQALIPLTVMNEVINTVRKKYGNLYSKVRKTAIPGGVEYPIGALQASFKWINESTVSPRQRVGDLGKIMFGNHVAEIRVAQTFLSRLLTLSAFETELTRIIAVAYLEAMDYGIVNGSGNGCMTGILNDSRVTNTVTMTAAQIADWTQWRKRFFAQLPLGYRSGEFIFPVSTVDAYLETMADSNNNPIYRQATGLEVNDGDAANPNGRFFGREISLVEPDIIKDFDNASSGDVIGVYWQPDQYAINENFGFAMRRYFDEETNEWVDKALVVADGKVLNPTGFYKILKG